MFDLTDIIDESRRIWLDQRIADGDPTATLYCPACTRYLGAGSQCPDHPAEDVAA